MTNHNDDKNKEDHPDFDGIKENNNPIPLWFNALLVVTIIFSVAYMVYYHVISDGTPAHDEYLASMGKTSQQNGGNNSSDYSALVKKPEMISAGKQEYQANCASCHGDKGQGGVGPNLTDDYWIVGNTYADVHKAIAEGVLAKGMPGWKSILGEKKIQELVAFIDSIQGTNPPGAKTPEGKPGKLH